MKSNYTIICNTPITEYVVDSKGIRRIPSKKTRKNPPDTSKPPKRDKSG